MREGDAGSGRSMDVATTATSKPRARPQMRASSAASLCAHTSTTRTVLPPCGGDMPALGRRKESKFLSSPRLASPVIGIDILYQRRDYYTITNDQPTRTGNPLNYRKRMAVLFDG